MRRQRLFLARRADERRRVFDEPLLADEVPCEGPERRQAPAGRSATDAAPVQLTQKIAHRRGIEARYGHIAGDAAVPSGDERDELGKIGRVCAQRVGRDVPVVAENSRNGRFGVDVDHRGVSWPNGATAPSMLTPGDARPLGQISQRALTDGVLAILACLGGLSSGGMMPNVMFDGS